MKVLTYRVCCGGQLVLTAHKQPAQLTQLKHAVKAPAAVLSLHEEHQALWAEAVLSCLWAPITHLHSKQSSAQAKIQLLI